MGCSLALAGVAFAQQPEQQASPNKKQKKHGAEQTQAAEGQPSGATAGKPQAKPGKQAGAVKEHGPATQHGAMTNEPGPAKGHKGQAKSETAPAGTNVSGQPTGTETSNVQQQQQAEHAKKGKKGHAAAAEKAASSAGTTGAAAGAAGAAAAGANAGPSATIAGQQNARAVTGAGKAAKKPDPQQVQQIKAQHTNFRAQPKPQQVPAVTYNQNYRIQGSESWIAPQYQVFRTYRPEWHDAGWYRSRYSRVEPIGGGYYYFNNGYWYPAWGFSPSEAYYAYDGPIYVGHRAEPPDQVIADVQAELQQMGYYRGEVDGLLGPLTREALAAYQADQGLTPTAAIDEPTLDSLGMA